MSSGRGQVLVGGRDYPREWSAFLAWFPDDAACRMYLERLRWPEGFACRGCGHRQAWRSARGLLRCTRCRAETSLTAGTIFQDTRSPLTLWLAAAWLVTNEKQGVSALGLKRQLGLGSYETAWAWLHKLRRAMVRPDRDRLAGEVEVDETLVGGPMPGRGGRDATGKAIVAVAVERRGLGSGRVRLMQIPDCSRETLEAFVTVTIAPGAALHTDGWAGYAGCEQLGYRHWATQLTQTNDPAHVIMPRVHRVSSLLKRWLLGTHQGGVSVKHLDYYLDEFTFRFNRRGSTHRGLLFRRLLEQAVHTDPAPLTDLLT